MTRDLVHDDVSAGVLLHDKVEIFEARHASRLLRELFRISQHRRLKTIELARRQSKLLQSSRFLDGDLQGEFVLSRLARHGDGADATPLSRAVAMIEFNAFVIRISFRVSRLNAALQHQQHNSLQNRPVQVAHFFQRLDGQFRKYVETRVGQVFVLKHGHFTLGGDER